MAEPLDTGRPHPARVYDYLLGGTNNFAADRAAAAEGLKANPDAATAPRQNRAFMRRTVRFLAEEAGIRQFVDLGTGLPTSPSVHQVAQAVDPAARVVYSDSDPLVLAQARKLLSAPGTSYLDADLREPERILSSPEMRQTIDLDKPVALLLYAVLHFLEDQADPYGIVARLMADLPRGSYLVISHHTADHDPDKWAAYSETMRRQGIPTRLRSREEVRRFFPGMEMVEPGVVPILRWRPDEKAPFTDAQVALYGGVARKSS